jgi:hypothetical protein
MNKPAAFVWKSWPKAYPTDEKSYFAYDDMDECIEEQ